jgi:hypothetical protein
MPFYVPSGILLNGQQTGQITFAGQGVTVVSDTVNIPGVVLKQGARTIDSPLSITFAGTAVLTESSVPPSIVQSVSGQFGQTLTLGAPTTPGNILVMAIIGEGTPSIPAGWSVSETTGDGTPVFLGSYFLEVSSSEQTSITLNQRFDQATLYEIAGGNFSGVSSIANAASISGSVLSATATSFAQGDLIIHQFGQAHANSVYSSPLPTGAVIDSQSNGGNACGVNCHYAASSTGSETLEITTTNTNDPYFVILVVPPASGTANATVTT